MNEHVEMTWDRRMSMRLLGNDWLHDCTIAGHLGSIGFRHQFSLSRCRREVQFLMVTHLESILSAAWFCSESNLQSGLLGISLDATPATAPAVSPAPAPALSTTAPGAKTGTESRHNSSRTFGFHGKHRKNCVLLVCRLMTFVCF